MLSRLLALLLVTLPTQTPTPATAPATAESFIPANAMGVVRIRSIDAVEKAAQSIMPGLPVRDQILGLLPMVAPATILTEQIDTSGPIILAAWPSPAHPPFETMLILTCKDPAAFTAPLLKMGWSCTTAGKIVACSPSKPGPSLAADAPLSIGLDRNEVVLRVAMKQTMSRYGDVLKLGLDKANEEIGSKIPDEDTADNVSSMISNVADSLDQMEMLEVNLSQRGDQTRLGFEMTAADGSDLAKVAKVDTSSLPAAARIFDENGAVAMLAAFDFSKLAAVFQSFMDAASKTMPEEQRALFAGVMNMSKDLVAAQGPIMAGSFDFAAGGAHGAWYMQPKDPAAFMGKMIDVFSANIPWMKLTKTEHVQVDGVDASTLHFTIDTQGLAGTSKAASPEMRAALDKQMQALFGPGGAQYTMAVVNGAVISVMGDVGQFKAAMARVASKSTSPVGAELLQEMGAMNPGFVYRIDFGRLVAFMGSMAAQMESAGAPNVAADMDLMRSMPAMRISGGVEGRVWKLGISTEVAKFVGAFMQTRTAVPIPSTPTHATGSVRMRAKADITSIVGALDAFATNNGGKYPDSLEVLVTPDVNGYRYLNVKKLPLDPWGHAYVYTQPKSSNDHPRVSSLGADGKVGGTGDAADIDNLSDDRDDR